MKGIHRMVMVSLLAGCSGAQGHGDSPASVHAAAGGAGAVSAHAAQGGAPATASGAGTGTAAAGRSGSPSSGDAEAGASSAAASGGSAAGATGADGSIPATFATVKLVLGGGGGIMPCAAAPCHGVHGMAPPAHPLELPPNDDQQLYTNLTTYVSAACDNIKLVEPGKPADSALLKILSGPCGKTPRMPYGCSAEAGDCIPDDYIAAVAQWITNGAPH